MTMMILPVILRRMAAVRPAVQVEARAVVRREEVEARDGGEARGMAMDPVKVRAISQTRARAVR